MTKKEAIEHAVNEVVFTRETVKVEVETGMDEYGVFVRVHHNKSKSSKIRYEEHLPQDSKLLEVI